MKIFTQLNLKPEHISGYYSKGFQKGSSLRDVHSPIDRSLLASVSDAKVENMESAISEACSAFETWRKVPAPKRGELVRIYGNILRRHKTELAQVITHEVGKIPSEAEGEVQEMIDVCDMAVGQSRQLFGLTIASERKEHRLMEQWHPIGPVGIISAFNFPMAVWSWNAMLAIVCGNSVIWKPSEKAPLCAIACQALFLQALQEYGEAPDNLSTLVLGGVDIGETLCESKKVALVSATGSTRMGTAVAQSVAARMGKYLLELGGNNAMIVAPSADVDLAIRAIVFSAVGTTGQRCTTLRRLIVHHSLKEELLTKLKKAYSSIKIGSPLEDGVLMGPLIDEAAAASYFDALSTARTQGGSVWNEGRVCEDIGGAYVQPAIVEISKDASIVQTETFAPILYLLEYNSIDEAIQINNSVPQGLSSSIFTKDIQEAEIFLSPSGSDCGMANVNIGTSGAEVGGAFGGEKETGGGRECGSDSWKNYMRRTTNTVNYSSELPLAQGVEFV